MNQSIEKMVKYLKDDGLSDRDHPWLREAIENVFCEAHDFEYFKIGMYHGTDRFIWEMDEQKRKQYLDALHSFINACGKSIELDNYLSAKVKELYAQKIDTAPIIGIYSMLQSIKNKDSMYEYQNLYFTPHLRRAGITYAQKAYKFGEIGNLAFSIWRIVQKENIHIEHDSDTERLMNEWYDNTVNRKSDPIIIKLKPEAFQRIEANEKGEIFDEKSILKFKYKYLDIALNQCKCNENDADHALTVKTLPEEFIGFRTDRNLTDDDFTVLEWEETDLEIERTIDNKNRLKKDYFEFIEHYCTENEKSLNDETFLLGLKERFGIMTLSEFLRSKQR